MMKMKMPIGDIIQKPREKVNRYVYHPAKMMTLVKQWNGRILIASGGKKGAAIWKTTLYHQQQRQQEQHPLNQQHQTSKTLLQHAQR